jgi:hypothetical protein
MREPRISKFAAREVMQRHGYDPITELMRSAMDENVSGEVKRDIAMFLTPYMYPKLATVAVESEVEVTNNSISQNELMARILENPDLCDAAQRISLVAAEIFLENDRGSQQIQ